MPAHTPESILTLARNFWECRILLTAAELDVFSLLTPAPLSATDVTSRLAGDQRAVTILLDALTAMELLVKREGRYECPPAIAAALAADSPRSVLPMVLHSASLWHRWHELTGVVQGDAAARARAQAPRSDKHLEAFIGAMHVVAGPQAAAIVAQINPGVAQRLLDIGGASGTYTLALLRLAPQMRATLFDRPAVVEMARARLTEAGMLGRVALASGDFDVDELPPGHDLALLSAIIHQNSRAENVELYRKVWRALTPGGRLVIRDHVMSPERTAPRRGAIFAVNMLVGTPGGNTYTFDEIRGDLATAGFERARLMQAEREGMDGLVEAFKPARA